ncbi:hypothetical protein GGX14DRAFT_401619 [Mycena pura]|uniref:Uncharacterized protein n=1 Tax=Mycena pura TaxID=153505 RepID=A0AAD6Y4K1_9AGAR|nr:hypothetical protein GGX14DRAFT_401619 [Mycena pura]
MSADALADRTIHMIKSSGTSGRFVRQPSGCSFGDVRTRQNPPGKWDTCDTRIKHSPDVRAGTPCTVNAVYLGVFGIWAKWRRSAEIRPHYTCCYMPVTTAVEFCHAYFIAILLPPHTTYLVIDMHTVECVWRTVSRGPLVSPRYLDAWFLVLGSGGSAYRLGSAKILTR